MDYLISYLCISILCLIWLFRRGMKLKVLDYVPYFFIFPVNIFANFAFTWFSPHYDVELWSNVYFLVIFGVFIFAISRCLYSPKGLKLKRFLMYIPLVLLLAYAFIIDGRFKVVGD